VIGTVIRPAVTWLHRRGLPRITAVILVYLLLLVLLIGFVALLFPLIVEQGTTIAAAVPGYYQSLQVWMANYPNQMIVRLSQFLLLTLPNLGPVPQSGAEILASAGQALVYAGLATKIIFIAIVILLAVFASLTFVAYRDWAFLSETTGSRKGYRQWFFGLKTGHWYQRSNVETFIQAKFPNELQHRWTSYAGTGKNIYGARLLYGHGMPGPVRNLPLDFLDRWFDPLPESEKKAFYDLLVTGDAEAIQQKVKAIVEEASSRP